MSEKVLSIDDAAAKLLSPSLELWTSAHPNDYAFARCLAEFLHGLHSAGWFVTAARVALTYFRLSQPNVIDRDESSRIWLTIPDIADAVFPRDFALEVRRICNEA